MEVEKSEESDLPRLRGFGVSSSIRDTPVVLDYPAVFGATEVERYYMKVDGGEEDYGQMRFAWVLSCT